MATYSGNGSGTTGASSYTLKLDVWEVSVDNINNKSNVGWSLKLVSGSYNFIQWNIPTYVFIDGEVYNASPKLSISANSEITIASGNKDVYHNSDGKKTISVSAKINNAGAYYLPGNITVGGTFDLTYIPRYINFTQHYAQSKTLNTITINWASDEARNYTQYNLNGGSWIDAGDSVASNNMSGTYVISNLNPATTYNIKTRIKSTKSGLWTESGTLTVTTYDIAKINDIKDVTIGENIELKYINSSNAEVQIGLFKEDGTTIIRNYTNVSNGIYNIEFTEDEIEYIYSLCPNSLFIKLRFYIKTTQNNNSYTSYITTSFNVNQSTNKPNFGSFSFYESDENVAKLIGKHTLSVLKGRSSSYVEISPATAKNSASIIRYEITNGDTKLEATINPTVINAIFYHPNTATFTVTAIDSRGLSSSLTLVGTLYDYSFPYIKSIIYKREGGVGERVFFELDAIYDATDYPNGENEHEVKYRYKKSSDTVYSDWYNITEYSGLVIDSTQGTIKNATTHNFIPKVYKNNIEIGDNLNNIKLQFNIPENIETDFTQMPEKTIIKVDDNRYVKEHYNTITGYGMCYIVSVFYPDTDEEENSFTEHIVFAKPSKGDVFTNLSEFQLPSNFGIVTQIDNTSNIYEYIFNEDEIDENAYLEFETGVEYNIEFRIKDTLDEWIKGNTLSSGIPCRSQVKNDDGYYSTGINCFPDNDYAHKVIGNSFLNDTDMDNFFIRNDGVRISNEPIINGVYDVQSGNSQIFSNCLAYEANNTTYGILFVQLGELNPTSSTKFVVKGFLQTNDTETEFKISFYASSYSISNAKCEIKNAKWLKDIYICNGESGIIIGFVHTYDEDSSSSYDEWENTVLIIESIYTSYNKFDLNVLAKEKWQVNTVNDFSYIGITNKVKCDKKSSKLIAEHIFDGTSSSITFNSLDILADGGIYEIYFSGRKENTAAFTLIEFNGIANASHYIAQRIVGTGTSLWTTATSGNETKLIFYVDKGGAACKATIMYEKTRDRACWLAESNSFGNVGVQDHTTGYCNINNSESQATDNIKTIRIFDNNGLNYVAGSKIQIYKK